MVTFLTLYSSVIVHLERMAVPLGTSWGSGLNYRVPPKERFEGSIFAQVSLVAPPRADH